VLLQELLCQVLQIPAGELNVADDFDLTGVLLADLDVVAEVANAALDLDTVMQELLECGNIEDLVVDRLTAIDNVLLGDLARLGGGLGFLNCKKHT